jgi:hypothetical protein
MTEGLETEAKIIRKAPHNEKMDYLFAPRTNDGPEIYSPP